MQTVADGAKQGSVRTGVQVIQNERVKGLYCGVSTIPFLTFRELRPFTNGTGKLSAGLMRSRQCLVTISSYTLIKA